jgi:hypothetical protein
MIAAGKRWLVASLVFTCSQGAGAKELHARVQTEASSSCTREVAR